MNGWGLRSGILDSLCGGYRCVLHGKEGRRSLGMLGFLMWISGEVLAAPLPVDSQFTLNSLHLSAYPQSAMLVPESEWSVETYFAWTNTFVFKDEYLVDVEQRELELTVHYGVSDLLSLAVSVPVVWRGGGTLDRAISSWHDWFGLPDGDRNKAPENQYMVEGANLSGRRFSLTDSGTSLGNLRLALQYALASGSLQRGGGVASSLLLSTSLPTSQLEYGHRSVDVGLAWLTTYASTDWRFDGSVWALWYSRSDIGELKYRPLHPEASVSVEYQLFDSLALVGGILAGVQPLENLTEVKDGFMYLDFGVRMPVSENYSAALLVRENPFPSRESADVSFIIGFQSGVR